MRGDESRVVLGTDAPVIGPSTPPPPQTVREMTGFGSSQGRRINRYVA